MSCSHQENEIQEPKSILVENLDLELKNIDFNNATIKNDVKVLEEYTVEEFFGSDELSSNNNKSNEIHWEIIKTNEGFEIQQTIIDNNNNLNF